MACNFNDLATETKKLFISLKNIKERHEIESKIKNFISQNSDSSIDEIKKYLTNSLIQRFYKLDNTITDVLTSDNIDFYYKNLSNKINFDISFESHSKQDTLDPVDREKEAIAINYLQRHFGVDSAVQNIYKSFAKNHIFGHIIADLSDQENPHFITTQEEINDQLFKLQIDLLNKIRDWLNHKLMSKEVNELSELINQFENDDDKNVIFQSINKFFETIFTQDSFGKNFVRSIEKNGENVSETAEAFFSYIMLINFDSTLRTILKDAIQIPNGLFNKYSKGKRYILSPKAAMADGWRNEEQLLDDTNEIGGLTKELVYLLPRYKKINNSWTRDTTKLTFKQFVNAKTKISQILDDNKDKIHEKYGELTVKDQEDLFKIFPGNDNDYKWKLYNKYVRNHSLYQMLSNINYSVTELAPLALYFLIKSDVFNDLDLEDQQGIVSIFHGVFDYSNPQSFINLSLNTTNSSLTTDKQNTRTFNLSTQNDYFLYIAQLFSSIDKQHLSSYSFERDLETGEAFVKRIPLQSRDINFRVRLLSDILNGKNDYNEAFFYKTNGQEKTESDVLEKKFGISVNLKNLENEKDRKIVLETDNYILTIKPNSYYINYKNNVDEVIEKALYAFAPLFNAILPIDVMNEQFLNEFGNIEDLFAFSSAVLYRKALNEKLYYFGIDSTKIQKEAIIYYNLVESQYKNINLRKNSNQLEMFPSTMYPKFKNIASAYDVVNGIVGDQMVTDNSGNQISQVKLSQASCKHQFLWSDARENVDNPTSHFLVYDAFVGVDFVRDFKDDSGRVIKITECNPSEQVISNFIYDFYGSSVQDGIIHVFGPIISDKPNIMRIGINLDVKIPYLGYKTLRDILVEKDSKNFNKNIITIFQKELGAYYLKQYKFVQNQLNLLEDIFEQYPIEDLINNQINLSQEEYELFKSLFIKPTFKNIFSTGLTENFKQFNEYTNALRGNLIALYNQLSLKENRTNTENSLLYKLSIFNNFSQRSFKQSFIQNLLSLNKNIVFIDNLFGHFEGNDFCSNHLLIDNVIRYSEDEQFFASLDDDYRKKYWEKVTSTADYKNSIIKDYDDRIISDLLKSNLYINVNNEDPVFNPNSKKTEYQKTKELLFDKDWKRKESNIRILAKLKYNGESLEIATQRDFIHSQLYRDIKGIIHYNLLDEKTEQAARSLLLEGDYFSIQSIINFVDSSTFLYAIDRLQLIRQINEKYYNTLTFEQKNQFVEFLDQDLLNQFIEYFEDEYGEKAKEQAIKSMLINMDFNEAKYMFNQIGIEFEEIENKFANNDREILTMTVNPAISRYNLISMLFNETYTDSIVGSFLNHPYTKKGKESIREMEASAMGARVKRNVSFTATKHQYILNSLVGIPSELQIAVVQDLENYVYNLVADGVKIEDEEFEATLQILQDGATLVDASMCELENNSLQNERVGIDKKQFGHMLNPQSGTGFILKTAGFVLTNERMRKSPIFRLLNKQMKSQKWLNEGETFNGKNFVDFTRDFYGRKIDFKSLNIYYAEPTNIDDDGNLQINHYRVFDVIMGNDGTVTVKRKLLQNRIQGENNDEEYINNEHDLVFKPGEISSNYDLWSKVLGGEFSESYIYQNGANILSYDNDNSSNKILALLMNLIGGKELVNNDGTKNYQYFNTQDVVLSQLQCKQILKRSMVAYIATEGAVKQGATNVNSNRLFTDPNYKMTVMKLIAKDLGVQLNAEHTVEQSTIAIMTQVMNAAAARGYSIEEGSEIYRILRQIALDAIQDELNGIKLGTPEARLNLQEAIADIIVKTLKYAQSTDSNILQAIANNIKNINFNQTTKLQFVRDTIPIDNPAILKQIVSKVAIALQKATLKLRPPGNMNVLVPGDGFIKLYDGKTLDQYGTIELAQKFLQAKQLKREQDPDRIYYIPQENPGLLLLGHTYKYIENGITKSVTLKHPGYYWSFSDKLFSGQITDVIEDITVGVDLSEANYFYRDKATGRLYNIWDLAVVRDRWEIEKLIHKAKNAEITFESEQLQKDYIQSLQDERKKLIYALQEQLNILDPTSDEDEVEVFDHFDNLGRVVSKKIKFDKSTVEQKAFDAIVPKSFADEFMLYVGDNLSDIKNDKNFFLKRLISIYDTIKVKCYDIAFLSPKRNTYIIYNGNRNLPEGFVEKKMVVSYDKGHCYRLDEDSGNIIYELPTDEKGNYREDTKLFVDEYGNEVLLTSDINFFIDNLDYVDVKLSNSHTLQQNYNNKTGDNEKYVKDQKVLLEQLSKSNNKLLKDLSNKILSERKSIEKELKKQTKNSNKEQNIEIDYADIVATTLQQFEEDLQKIKKGKTDIESYVLKHFLKQSNIMYNSFLNSLEFIVSRTPAQCQQSFMSMRVAAFDNSGLNSIYVSRFQLYFQGSDFDIDKANILTHEIKNGYYQTWSPLYDLSKGEDVRQASRKLPFPTGVEITPESNPYIEGETEDFYSLVDQFGLAKLVNIDGKISPENQAKYITQISKLIKYLNRNKNIGIQNNIQTDILLYAYKKVLDDINKHNTYFANNPKKNKIGAMYNRISTLIFDISLNPVNWIQGWASVDVVTEPFSTAADKSAQAKESKTFTGRSVMALAKQQSLTIEGKSNVGIAANSLKVYEAIAHAMYETLAFGSEDEIRNMLFNIKIIGKEIHIFANAWVNNKRLKELPDDLQELLLGVDNVTDAYTSLSALLSLAADNAKNPTLSKINGGPKMIGLYTAGIVLGLKPDELIDIINSPTGRLLSDLMKGNVFYGQYGEYDLLSTLNYIFKNPLFELPDMPEEVANYIKSIAGFGKNEEINENNLKQIQQLFGDKDHSTDYGRQLLSQLSKYKRQLEIALSKSEENVPDINPVDTVLIAKHILDEIRSSKDYIQYKKLERQDPLSEEFKELSKNNLIQLLLQREEELKNFIANPKGEVPSEVKQQQNNIESANQILLNTVKLLTDKISTQPANNSPEQEKAYIDKQKKDAKDTKNKIEYIINYINRLLNIEYKYLDMIDIVNSDWINKTKNIYNISELIYVNAELRVMSNFTSLNQGYPNKIDEQIQWISDFERLIGNRIDLLPKSQKEELKDDIEAFKALTDDKYQVDFKRFAVDEDYREQIIAFYDKIKKCCNPYRTIVKAEHYLGYFQSMTVLVDGMDSISTIYNKIRQLSPKLLNEFKANGQDGIILEKKIQDFLNFVSHRLFFQNILRDFTFRMKEEDPPIYLISPEGRDKFKEYMDKTIFPYLISNFPNNEFIKSLIYVEYTGNPDHKITLNYKSSVSAMPKTDYEKEQFRKVKKGLYKLQQNFLEGTDVPIVQLIFLYNLIAYEGKIDPRTFTAFFEELIAENNDTLIRSYNDFWSKYLPNHGLTENKDYTEEELYTYIAPIISQREALDFPKKPYAYVIDNKTKRSYLLKRGKVDEVTLQALEQERSILDDVNGPKSLYDKLIDKMLNSGRSKVYKPINKIAFKSSDMGVENQKEAGIDAYNFEITTSNFHISVSAGKIEIKKLDGDKPIIIHKSHLKEAKKKDILKQIVESSLVTTTNEDGSSIQNIDIQNLEKQIDYFSKPKEENCII